MRIRSYPSRVDIWLVAVTIAPLVLLLGFTIATYSQAPAAALVNLGVIGMLVLIGALFAYPCDYTLAESELVIRSGVIRQRIAYRDITGIEKSGSLWAGPALSLRRVKISYAGRFQLISPREREEFIDDLSSRLAAARSRV
jgi:membrane protein YdbS with pleckstrin-like domain